MSKELYSKDCIRKRYPLYFIDIDDKHFFEEKRDNHLRESNVIDFISKVNEQKVRFNSYEKKNDEWHLIRSDIVYLITVAEYDRPDLKTDSVTFWLITSSIKDDKLVFDLPMQCYSSSEHKLHIENDKLVTFECDNYKTMIEMM